MESLTPLSALGPRICILGPSNSGKSTLAQAIAKKTGREAVHLDQLYHLPHTRWQPRPAQEFIALHAAAVARDAWVMDGNYTKCLSPRLERATGLILLDISTPLSLFRYLRRSLFEKQRAGGLAGGYDNVNFAMLKYILLTTPGNKARYRELFAELELPKVLLNGAGGIGRCYREWGLEMKQARERRPPA